MSKGLVVEKSILINATPAKVWDAITDPAKVKQYLFGTNMAADWRIGGRITYSGSWEGKEYVDGGEILEIVPEKILKSTYWSSMSGTEDKPENYLTVSYVLEPITSGTKLTVIQDNNKTAEGAEHSGSNWQMVLEAMKKICEA
ncbi:MAG TPA: SRPBCC family protein [Candidatus Kapabacteria bacterium]|nr:SRPBCC family protein [Candidatus Kapabacteria bacterium]